ncbi:hypothetical protein ELY33_17085 [Vreelandella andesensis]|uniref:Uncharacterized protein n=1 Tax=Vreelandella andesensis TaxID=447567 RepID=A0A3S1DHT0_9GAMM|nr:hypothetical protein [Halomonas andesensis]RUR26822.1 hypothetical protein ELY33_17085 [Halomonas andesensis]
MSKEQPIHLRLEILRDDNGNQRAAWVAASATDATAMRERGYKPGAVTRADMKQPRNIGFHRLAHAIGGLIAEHIDDFNGMGQHEAIKELQFKSGIECEVTRTEIPGIGILESKQPRSLAFSAMEQERFYKFVASVCEYIAQGYWPQCTPEQIEDMASAMISREEA